MPVRSTQRSNRSTTSRRAETNPARRCRPGCFGIPTHPTVELCRSNPDFPSWSVNHGVRNTRLSGVSRETPPANFLASSPGGGATARAGRLELTAGQLIDNRTCRCTNHSNVQSQRSGWREAGARTYAKTAERFHVKHAQTKYARLLELADPKRTDRGRSYRPVRLANPQSESGTVGPVWTRLSTPSNGRTPHRRTCIRNRIDRVLRGDRRTDTTTLDRRAPTTQRAKPTRT
ncbi:hypothetical protein ABIB34_002130 [Rhodococcus sp. UYP5]